MKTHEFATALIMLGNMLRRAPNQPLDEFNVLKSVRSKADTNAIPLALSTLVSLSDFDKSQWLHFIHENKFAIEVRPRDASRDLIGKILNYLAENPDARKKITSRAQTSRTDSSPELMRALELLLKE